MLLSGVVLVILGLVIASASVPNVSSLISNAGAQRIALGPQGLAYAGIRINTTGFLYVSYNSSRSPINFYIVNGSTFNALRQYLNSSKALIQAIKNLQGRGVVLGFTNSTKGIFPYNSSYSSLGFPKPTYSYNATSLIANGTYYAVYTNPGSNYTNVTYSYLVPKIPTGPNNLGGSTVGSIASSLIFIAGFVLVLYSFFRKVESKQSEAKRQEEVEELYKRIEKRERAKTKRRRRGS